MDQLWQETMNSPDDDSSEVRGERKRRRVRLACQRCKGRKQKCDGGHPACSNCLRARVECQYTVTQAPKSHEQGQYTKALEERIAALESQLSSAGLSSIADDHWESATPKEDIVNPLSGVIRELSLNASGYFVGGTTHVSLGRLLGPALQGKVLMVPDGGFDVDESREPDAVTDTSCSESSSSTSFSGRLIETKFEAYMTFVSLDLPFILSRKLRKIHENRHSSSGVWETAILHLVCAIGGRSLELEAGCRGDYASDMHYEVAMQQKDCILQYLDRRTVIFLVLASVYCLRSPKALGPWTMIHLAMKVCIGLGLHRKSKTAKFGLASELDRRLFWTCYCLDRDTAISTGRPPSISDHDIDTLLPMDVDEESIDGNAFYRAAGQDRNVPADPPTTLTHFIHMVRLKRLQSAIQHHIYRVDQEAGPSQTLIEQYLAKLSDWKQQLPTSPSNTRESGKSPRSVISSGGLHFNRDSYIMQYSESVRLLLFPFLFQEPVPEDIVKRCAEACETWVFLSGLTLIYCAWYAPRDILKSSTISAIGACSTMLYIMTERRPSASRYRDAFESLKQCVFDQLLCPVQEPRATIASVPSETRAVLDSLDPGFSGTSTTGLNNIIDSITRAEAMDKEFDLQDCDFTTDNLRSKISPSLPYEQINAAEIRHEQGTVQYNRHGASVRAGLESLADHGWPALVLDGDKDVFSITWDPMG